MPSKLSAPKNTALPCSEGFTGLSLRGHEVRGVLDGSITRLFRPIDCPEWVSTIEIKRWGIYGIPALVGFSNSGKREFRIEEHKIPFQTIKSTPYWYVKENWCIPFNSSGIPYRYEDNTPMYFFEADMDCAQTIIWNSRRTVFVTNEKSPLKTMFRWNPPKSMPREASRILLALPSDTQFKSIDDFSEEDALCGGISITDNGQFTCKHLPKFGMFPTAVEALLSLWDKTYGKNATCRFVAFTDIEKIFPED